MDYSCLCGRVAEFSMDTQACGNNLADKQRNAESRERWGNADPNLDQPSSVIFDFSPPNWEHGHSSHSSRVLQTADVCTADWTVGARCVCAVVAEVCWEGYHAEAGRILVDRAVSSSSLSFAAFFCHYLCIECCYDGFQLPS